MRTLEEQVVIITGAARGIGKSIANSVAKAGGHAIVTDILEGEAEETAAAIRASGGKATALRLDITRPEQAEEIAAAVIE
ncbi:MAG: SDR family NAD(P)-dependent oxidoreductase, partial [Shinella sp.]